MPPTPTIAQSPPRPPRARSRLPLLVAAVVACGLLLLQVSIVLRGPDRIGALTIHNETDFHLNVALSGSPDGSRLMLGQVRRNGTKTVASVVDPGQTFVFELSYGGVESGTITVDRSALETDQWQLTIPTEMSQPLHDAGLAPPPR